MFIILCFRSAFVLISPIALNKILLYLESHGSGMTVRPWVWILVLFAGTLGEAILFELYLYAQTRLIVKTEGIFTQLVFERALQMRFTENDNDGEKGQEASSLTTTLVHTPANEEQPAAGSDSPSNAEDHVQQRSEGEETVREGSESESAADSKGKGKGKELSRSTPAPEAQAAVETSEPKPLDKSKQSSNLVGRLNNLVSTDLKNLTDGEWLFSEPSWTVRGGC